MPLYESASVLSVTVQTYSDGKGSSRRGVTRTAPFAVAYEPISHLYSLLSIAGREWSMAQLSVIAYPTH